MFDDRQVSSYIVKLTGDCNLGCSYCYHFGGVSRVTDTRMNPDLIDQIIEQAASGAKDVQFIWHGGEPLLAGLNTFERILQTQRRIHLSYGVNFRNAIQTNATLINDQWVDLFRRADFDIGVSLDGPEWLHNKSRIYLSAKGSYAQTIRGVNLLQQKGVRFGTLAVVTKESLGHARELFDFFISHGITNFDFLTCVEVDKASIDSKARKLKRGSLAKGDFAAFMKDIFDIWIERDDPSIRIRYLDNVLAGLFGGEPSLCKFKGNCHEFVTVMSTGHVLPCDNFVGYQELTFGNLNDRPLSEILDGVKRRKFIASVSTKRRECKTCEYLLNCGGGCNKYSYMWNGSFQDENYFCKDRWQLFTYISDVLNREHPLLLTRYTNANRNAATRHTIGRAPDTANATGAASKLISSRSSEGMDKTISETERNYHRSENGSINDKDNCFLGMGKGKLILERILDDIARGTQNAEFANYSAWGNGR